METQNIAQQITTFVLALVLLIIGMFGLTYFAHPKPISIPTMSGQAETWPAMPGISQEIPEAMISRRVTLTGKQVCLPHRDTTGPQTLECAIGMQTTDGKYYGLDFALMSQIPPTIQNGNTFTASGLLTPVEMLSADHWQKYNMEGIFSVTDNVVIEK